MEPNQMQISEIERKDLAWLKMQPLDMRLEVLNHHLTICQMYLNELFEEEVIQKAGPATATQSRLMECTVAGVTILEV